MLGGRKHVARLLAKRSVCWGSHFLKSHAVALRASFLRGEREIGSRTRSTAFCRSSVRRVKIPTLFRKERERRVGQPQVSFLFFDGLGQWRPGRTGSVRTYMARLPSFGAGY